MTEAVQAQVEAATTQAEAIRKRPKEAQARFRRWVKRAIAELPADALNRLAATCAMHLDQETLKRTGKSPGYAKTVVDELAADRVAKVVRPVVIDHEKVKALRGEGKKYRGIAAELGISIASVARILKGRRHE